MDPLMRYILFLLALFMLGCEENVPVSEHAIHYKQAKKKSMNLACRTNMVMK
jgi:hypothetical protein